jgi:hypothetical protein
VREERTTRPDEERSSPKRERHSSTGRITADAVVLYKSDRWFTYGKASLRRVRER